MLADVHPIKLGKLYEEHDHESHDSGPKHTFSSGNQVVDFE